MIEPTAQETLELAERIDREVAAADCTIDLVRREKPPYWTTYEYQLARALVRASRG